MTSLDQLLTFYRNSDCSSVYAKRLADNDNSKNQVYFGSDFQALNILPNLDVLPANSGKHEHPIFKAKLNFSWVTAEGALNKAPGAQIIFYPQYPEVRFSGFLQGCRNAPKSQMLIRESGRWLVLGVKADGEILGYVASPNHGIAHELETVPASEALFCNLTSVMMKTNEALDSKAMLLNILKGVAAKEWIDSRRLLKSGGSVPCKSRNCGGYTLEAEFGITPNGFSEPDFMGWEIKQYNMKSSAITLMTPEPTEGIYADEGVKQFLHCYGYPDATNQERVNFSSPHRIGTENNKTGLKLITDGYDAVSGVITNAFGKLALVDKNDIIAAAWKFDDLMRHWNRKHALAVYVPSTMQKNPAQQYRYHHVVQLCLGTDFLRFLKAFSSGNVVYDPGVKMEPSRGKMKTKRRNQFRTRVPSLASLYKRIETVDLRTYCS